MTSQVDVNDMHASQTPETPDDCYGSYPAALAQVAREEEGRMVHLLTIASAGYEEVPIVVDFRRAATALLECVADSGEDHAFTTGFVRDRLRESATGLVRGAELRQSAARLQVESAWKSALVAYRRQRRQQMGASR